MGTESAGTNTPPVTVTFPAGDVKAGRQAFIDLKCTACHAVLSEPEFPPPVTTNPAPPIDARLAGHDASYLVSAIISPSHDLSHSGSDEELRARLKGVLPPMGDFSRLMTVRQLMDLHAYLRSFK